MSLIDLLEERWDSLASPIDKWTLCHPRLLDAATKGRTQLFLRLLQFSGRAFDGSSLCLGNEFLLAAVEGSSATDTTILDKVWELGARGDVEPGLGVAITKQRRTALTWLFEHGVDPLIAIAPERRFLHRALISDQPTSLILLAEIKRVLAQHPELQHEVTERLARPLVSVGRGETPLEFVISSGWTAGIEALLDVGADPDHPARYCLIGPPSISVSQLILFSHFHTFRDEYNSTAICRALTAKAQRKKTLRLLLDRNANPNPPLKETDALSLAVATGRPGLVTILLQRGTRTDGFPLHSTFSVPCRKTSKKLRIAKLLLAHGADINKFHPSEGRPIDTFCRYCNLTNDEKVMKALRWLLKEGARVSLRTLLDASDAFTEELLMVLWENFLLQDTDNVLEDPQKKKKALSLILVKAAYLGVLPLVTLLIERYGVDANSRCEGEVVPCISDGDTALMAVLRKEQGMSESVFEYLLSQDADPSFANATAETAFHLAQGLFSSTTPTIHRLLKEHGGAEQEDVNDMTSLFS